MIQPWHAVHTVFVTVGTECASTRVALNVLRGQLGFALHTEVVDVVHSLAAIREPAINSFVRPTVVASVVNSTVALSRQ